MKSIQEHFAEFNNPCYFSRVDKNHILDLHIGLDEKGQKVIELRSKKFKPRNVSNTGVIEVGQFKNNDYYTIRFTLIDDEMSSVFYKFCEDLVEETRTLTNTEDGYKTVVERYYKWKKMFLSKSNLLSESQIMGLIGEILFLKDDLSNRIGQTKALESWSGQELTHKDFSYENNWFEIKAISKSNTSVKISSLEQLESESNGELVVFGLEKMSETYKGITLNNLVFKTIDSFSNQEDKDNFIAKISLQGYEYNKFYDKFVYEISFINKYLVNEEFPKLTRKDVNKAIERVSYTIALNQINDFQIKD